MLKISLILFISTISTATYAKTIAGGMSEREICQTSGYLIRQKLGSKVKTINIKCNVTSKDGYEVFIESGYRPPIGNKTLRYEAKGSAFKDKLTIHNIKVIDIDPDFIPFRSFP